MWAVIFEYILSSYTSLKIKFVGTEVNTIIVLTQCNYINAKELGVIKTI